MTTVVQPSELHPLDDRGRALLFTEARTARAFRDEPVSDEQLSEIWELARWAPTASNIQPMRAVFVRTPEGRERLAPHMNDNNRERTFGAPAVAILAADLDFHEFIPQLSPRRPELKNAYEEPKARSEQARFNAILQAGYFVLAVRAVGFAAGPMLGFDAAGIDAAFFAGTSLRTVLVVNIGVPGENAWRDRSPRLDHSDVITWA